MNRFLTYFLCLLVAGVCSFLSISCQNWDLPGLKSKRNCVKPSGSLTATAQERKVDFAISNSSGTIDKINWDFGNGSTSATTGMTVSYSYPTSGTYTVKATLTNTCTQETIMTLVISAADAVIPTVSLQTPTNVSTNSATAGMTVTSTGNATITRYGICYSSVNQVPNVDKGDFTSEQTASININTPASFTLANLQPNTTYYVRSFAVNKAGTGYSSPVQSFTTGSIPVVSVAGTPTISINSTTVNFVVMNPGRPAAVEYGICYAPSSVTNTPTTANLVKQVTSPAVNTYTPVELTNLTPNTTYYYRVYAKLSTGEIVYSSVQSFMTQIDTLAQDLIASVSFNDQSLLDISGNNNHVKLMATSFTTDHLGRANSAVALNGSGDYFYIPESSSLNPNALTVSLWIKPAAKPTSAADRMQVYNKSRFSDGANEMYSSLIKLKGDVGPNLAVMTDIKQNSNCIDGNGWQSLPFDAPIVLNNWYHLVFTYSGRSARMYFNNIQVFATDALPADKIDYCPGGDLKFGAQSQKLPWYFKGAMDDIRIYKRALTAAEVEMLFKQ